VQSIVRRLGKTILPLSDQMMSLLLQIIQTAPKQSPVLEDAFLCVGAMISSQHYHNHVFDFMLMLLLQRWRPILRHTYKPSYLA